MKRKRTGPPAANPARSLEVCILAGGRSSRMGWEKAGLRLGRRTLLGHVRATARECDFPIRVIRNDRVPQCGPLGGVYTALATAPAEAVLFLSCDMPFVSAGLLRSILRRFSPQKVALFVERDKRVGFPFLLRRTTLPVIERQLAKKEFSLQQLARALNARTLRPSRPQEGELLNINTPADYERALQSYRERRHKSIHAAAPALVRRPLFL